MVSFAGSVKNELVHVEDELGCCKRAELVSLLRMGASISFNKNHYIGLNFATENAAVARRVVSLLKEGVNKSIPIEVTVRRSKRLRKQNTYLIKATPSSLVTEALSVIGFTSPLNLINPYEDKHILSSNCCIPAYLRGAFLGGGTVNQPESSYHLEFVSENKNFANLIWELCNSIYLSAGITDRKGYYIVYLKDFESIVELLGLMGLSDEFLEKFESVRNLREIRNQVNRLVNCETANLQKTIDTSVRQINIIKQLKKMPLWKKLKPNIKNTALLRVQYPEATLLELSNKLGCSKSAVYHRLNKLELLYSRKLEE